MSPARQQQTMKPVTAAKKLGIHLPAAPSEFRDAPSISRSELGRLMSTPPAWLTALREHGPHPRDVVASRLGVSIAGLTRGGLTEPLTTEEITRLAQDPPQWLLHERVTYNRVRAEEERVAARDAARGSRSAATGGAD
ncbi:DUF5997 family protein [Cellulomonas fimi]|uniref:Uncharacterized protein n=1 Tax=Cellulomonas fimi TaxID=1708 RepID=A0A7Y0QJS1_CELFI|nr:DUF5997 family protein [Cellulomonas fimi]NMR21647.1 hypothetical protein [Cellulomonas fimi]